MRNEAYGRKKLFLNWLYYPSISQALRVTSSDHFKFFLFFYRKLLSFSRKPQVLYCGQSNNLSLGEFVFSTNLEEKLLSTILFEDYKAYDIETAIGVLSHQRKITKFETSNTFIDQIDAVHLQDAEIILNDVFKPEFAVTDRTMTYATLIYSQGFCDFMNFDASKDLGKEWTA